MYLYTYVYIYHIGLVINLSTNNMTTAVVQSEQVDKKASLRPSSPTPSK